MRLAVDVFYHGLFASRFEGEVQVGHLEQNDAEAPDVNLSALGTTPDELRRQVGVAFNPFLLGLCHVPFPPERAEFDKLIVRQKQMFGIHVFVNVVDVVDLLHSEYDLC